VPLWSAVRLLGALSDGRKRISGQSVRFHLIVLVLTFEPVVVGSARETIRDALPVL